MACDIHLHIETKIDGKWEHWGNPDIDRWYCIFAKLAGVRNSDFVEPISEPRGIPDNATNVTMFSYNNQKCDAHSQSWINRQEIKGLNEWCKDNIDDWLSIEYNFIKTYCCGSCLTDDIEGIEDVRFIFWFDN